MCGPVLGALLLAGCAVGPPYRAPAAATPAAWQAVLPHDGTAAAMLDWWRQFDDPLLPRLIERAEADSPTLDKAWANIEKARANLQTAQAAGWPSLSGSAAWSRGTQQALPGMPATVATSRSAAADAAWEIDLFGKVRRNEEAARSRLEARTAQWHDARISLAAEVADTYVQYRACQQLGAAYERAQTSSADTERATAAAVRAGFNAPSDAALARASLASAAASALQQQAQCEGLVKTLVYLTGGDEVGLRAELAAGDGHLPVPAQLQVRSVPAQTLRQRPDLAALERELAASSADIGAAQADLYPSLSLSGSIGVSAGSLVASQTTWSFGPSLSLPLFDGGRRRAAVRSAEAGYAAALADYRAGVRTVVKEVEQALVNLAGAAARTEQAATAARAYRETFGATEGLWRAGGASLLSLEETRRSALSAEINEITLQRERVSDWITLYKALGGGWQPQAPVLPPASVATSHAASLAD